MGFAFLYVNLQQVNNQQDPLSFRPSVDMKCYTYPIAIVESVFENAF